MHIDKSRGTAFPVRWRGYDRREVDGALIRARQEVERLREERQELLQRLALAEARVMVLDEAPPTRWGLRRRG